MRMRDCQGIGFRVPYFVQGNNAMQTECEKCGEDYTGR